MSDGVEVYDYGIKDSIRIYTLDRKIKLINK